MLLATSMVLSSVSVGTFADELIFEPEVSATTEAGEDEAYFGDDVVTGDEQNEEDSASDETFFADGYYSRPFLTNKAAHRCSESPSFYQGIKIGQAECLEI